MSINLAVYKTRNNASVATTAMTRRGFESLARVLPSRHVTSILHLLLTKTSIADIYTEKLNYRVAFNIPARMNNVKLSIRTHCRARENFKALILKVCVHCLPLYKRACDSFFSKRVATAYRYFIIFHFAPWYGYTFKLHSTKNIFI